MPTSTDRFALELDELIERISEQTLKQIGKAQATFLDDLVSLVAGFDRDRAGNIKPTTKNLRILQDIKAVLPQTVRNADLIRSVKYYEAELDTLTATINEYLTGVSVAFDPNQATLEQIVINARELVRITLLDTGVGNDIVNVVIQNLNRNVTGGMPWKDMVKSIRDYLTLNDGRMVRWSKQVVNDGLFQMSRNYIQVASEGLGIDKWRYSGGTIKDSRPFCVQRNGNTYTTEQVRAWASLDWEGKNSATTEENIFQLCGGYNCRHNLLPASLED